LREWCLNYQNHTVKPDRIQIEINFLMRALLVAAMNGIVLLHGFCSHPNAQCFGKDAAVTWGKSDSA
jgi:hypothetical protein